MKSKIVKALVAFLFVMLSACTVCFYVGVFLRRQ